MLDTSKISSEKLPKAMYEEAMSVWSEASQHKYSTYRSWCDSLLDCTNKLSEAYEKKDYDLIQYYWGTMSFYLNETRKALYELRDVLRIKPKKPQRKLNDLSAANIGYDWRE